MILLALLLPLPPQSWQVTRSLAREAYGLNTLPFPPQAGQRLNATPVASPVPAMFNNVFSVVIVMGYLSLANHVFARSMPR